MAWDLGSWLCFVRSLQLLGTLVSGSLNGYLLAYIISNNLGESQVMVCLEWIICVLLIYTALNLLVIHTGGRSRKTPWLVYSVVMDVVCCGADLALLTLLARAGVPSNCGGLTRSDTQPGDAPDKPPPGYSTVRFSDESPLHKGQLDKYCALERSFYFIAVAIVFTYTTTITLSILRICEGRYTSIKEYHRVLNALHGDGSSYELANKTEQGGGGCGHRVGSVASLSPQTPAAPASEGVTSPRLSIRPTVPSPLHHVTQPIPPRPKLNVSVASSSRAPPPPPPLPPRSPPLPMGLGVASDDSQDHLAASAMITDGPRFNGGYEPGILALPPYSPRSPSRMSGHAYESNDMRLSGYVKGETRAQDMKDRGGGF